MRVLHAIEGLDRASGVATFVCEVANEQSRAGHEVAVVFVATDERTFDSSVLKVPGMRLETLPWRPDVVHLHGIWSRFSLKVLWWCRRQRISYVVSPHGGLMPRVFTYGRLKKRLVWGCVLRPLLFRAHAVHGTTATEVAAFRAAGLTGPFFIAPLGIRLPVMSDAHARTKTVLYMGRLSEEKGLDILLSAWGLLGAKKEGWRLILAGPDWRNTRSGLQVRIAREGIRGVVFFGSADEAAKARLYSEASLFVLASPMENFSMVVLEALAHGVPTIATQGTPWEALSREGCGWWIPQGVKPLAAALAEALGLTDEVRETMGAKGRRLAGCAFQWAGIAEGLTDRYG